jgi:hypothetical protein
VLDADVIATAIRGLMAAREEWVGTSSQLLHALEEVVGERVAKSKNWPSSAEALGRGLRRPATFLRKVGIEISFERDKRIRRIRITRTPTELDWVGEKPSQPSPPSFAHDFNRNGGDEPSPKKAHEINGGDGGDSSDSKIPTNLERT